jgi:hypothetical protein
MSWVNRPQVDRPVHRSAPTSISTPCVKAICLLAIGWSDLRAGSQSWMHGGRSPHVRSGRLPIVGPRGRGSLPRFPAVGDGVRRAVPARRPLTIAFTALDNCVHYAHVKQNRSTNNSTNNSLSRQVPPSRRLDRLPSPEHFVGDVLSTSNTKNSLVGGSAASKGGANTSSSVCRTEHISSSITKE